MDYQEKIVWIWIISAIIVIFVVPEPYDVLILMVSLLPYIYIMKRIPKSAQSKAK